MGFSRIALIVALTAGIVYSALYLIVPNKKVATIVATETSSSLATEETTPAAQAPLEQRADRNTPKANTDGASSNSEGTGAAGDKPARDEAGDETKMGQTSPSELKGSDASHNPATDSGSPVKPLAQKPPIHERLAKTRAAIQLIGSRTSAADPAWWTPVSAPGDGKLGLSYAGETDSMRAIALLFTSTFDNAKNPSRYIKVISDTGQAVGAAWTLAPNHRMLVLPVPKAGRYLVSISAEVADNQGKKLGMPVKGTLVIR